MAFGFIRPPQQFTHAGSMTSSSFSPDRRVRFRDRVTGSRVGRRHRRDRGSLAECTDKLVSFLVRRWLAARRASRYEHLRLGEHAEAEIESHLHQAVSNEHVEWTYRQRLSSLVTVLWGNSLVNKLADRAGSFRALALFGAVAAGPVAVLGIESGVASGSMLREPQFGALFAVAVCLLWLTVDLLRTGSLVSTARRPHLSVLGLVGSMTVISTGRVGFDGTMLSPVAMLGLVLCVAGLIVLVVGDLLRNILIDIAGRALSALGAMSFVAATIDSLVSSRAANGLAVLSLAAIAASLAGYGLAEGYGVSRRLRLLRSLLR